MKKVNWLCCLLLINGFLFWGSASAITLSFSPSSETVFVGDSFDVDVVVSGLSASNEIVSQFDLDVLYDPSVLSATGIQFSGNLGVVDIDTVTVTDFSLGFVDLFESSFLSNLELELLQPDDSMTLATLSFVSVSEGMSLLTFGDDPLFGRSVVGSDFFTSLPLDTVGQSQATVLAQQISEPATALLVFGGGLLAAGMKKRKFKLAKN